MKYKFIKLISVTVIAAFVSQSFGCAQGGSSCTPGARDGLRPVSVLRPRAMGERNGKNYYAELAAREPSGKRRLDQLIEANSDVINPVYIDTARGVLAAVILEEIKEERAVASLVICIKGAHPVIAEALVEQAYDCRPHEAVVISKATARLKRGRNRDIFRFDRKDSIYRPLESGSREDNRRTDFAEKNREVIKRFFDWYKKDAEKQNEEEKQKRLYRVVPLEDLWEQTAIHSGEEISAEEFFRAMCEVFGPVYFLTPGNKERETHVIVAELLAGDTPTRKRTPKDDESDEKIQLDELAIARLGKLYGDIIGQGFTSGKKGDRIRGLLSDALSNPTGQKDGDAAKTLAMYLRDMVVIDGVEDPRTQAIILLELAQEMVTDLHLQYQILQAPGGYERIFKGLDGIDKEDKTEVSISNQV